MQKNLLSSLLVIAVFLLSSSIGAAQTRLLSDFNGGGSSSLGNSVRSNFGGGGGNGAVGSLQSNFGGGGSSFGGSSGRRGFGFVGRGSIGTTHSNRHQASTNRLRRNLRIKKARLIRAGSQPICGTYGRLPASCRTGALNVASQR